MNRDVEFSRLLNQKVAQPCGNLTFKDRAAILGALSHCGLASETLDLIRNRCRSAAQRFNQFGACHLSSKVFQYHLDFGVTPDREVPLTLDFSCSPFQCVLRSESRRSPKLVNSLAQFNNLSEPFRRGVPARPNDGKTTTPHAEGKPLGPDERTGGKERLQAKTVRHRRDGVTDRRGLVSCSRSRCRKDDAAKPKKVAHGDNQMFVDLPHLNLEDGAYVVAETAGRLTRDSDGEIALSTNQASHESLAPFGRWYQFTHNNMIPERDKKTRVEALVFSTPHDVILQTEDRACVFTVSRFHAVHYTVVG
ncbi:MAG TPA: hypothetical protein VH643_39245 [Gemmataceae bacterium]